MCRACGRRHAAPVGVLSLAAAYQMEPPGVRADAVPRAAAKQHRPPAGQQRERVAHALVRPRARSGLRGRGGRWRTAVGGRVAGCGCGVQGAPPGEGRAASEGGASCICQRCPGVPDAQRWVPAHACAAQHLRQSRGRSFGPGRPAPLGSRHAAHVGGPAFRRLRQAARQVGEVAVVHAAAKHVQPPRGRHRQRGRGRAATAAARRCGLRWLAAGRGGRRPVAGGGGRLAAAAAAAAACLLAAVVA